jgi:hypothetical protein
LIIGPCNFERELLTSETAGENELFNKNKFDRMIAIPINMKYPTKYQPIMAMGNTKKYGGKGKVINR